MRFSTIFFIGLAIVCVVVSGDDSAESVEQSKDLRLYKVNVKNEQQLKELGKLVEEMKLQTLQDFRPNRNSYDVLVDSPRQNRFEEVLNKLKCIYKVKVDRFLDILSDLRPNLQAPKMNWTHYQQLETIYSWFDYTNRLYRPIIRSYTIGYSYENRPIKAAKISLKPGNKAIFMESGIHAVEWISSAAATCFLKNLLTSKDPEMRELLWNYDWIFVPMLNPDGFYYTHNVNKLWRKNRKPTGFSNSSGICYGTDLNRNFNFHWNVSGYNVDVPCDHWYGGNAPNSEPEVDALQKFVIDFPNDYIRMYLAIHSYGNLVLLPYGHTKTDRPSNYDQMMRISKGFADSAQIKYNTTFRYGASGDLLYLTSGSAKDWAHGVKGIPYTATVELRDTGKYGFFLPREQILEVCEEFTDGIVGMLKVAEQEHLFD